MVFLLYKSLDIFFSHAPPYRIFHKSWWTRGKLLRSLTFSEVCCEVLWRLLQPSRWQHVYVLQVVFKRTFWGEKPPEKDNGRKSKEKGENCGYTSLVSTVKKEKKRKKKLRPSDEGIKLRKESNCQQTATRIQISNSFT